MSDEPHERRKPGRPSLREGDRTVPLHVRLPARDYTQLADVASKYRMSVADVVRVSVRKIIGTPDRDR